MHASRVRELQLRLSVAQSLAHEAERVQRFAERELVVRMLEALERLVHARFGRDVVICIRRLASRWRVDHRELADPQLAARLAYDVFAQIEADVGETPPAQRPRPSGEHVVVFASPHHAAATYLADLADGTAAWYHPRATTIESTWAAVVSAGGRALRETVQWLRRLDRLDLVLAHAPDDVLDHVVVAVPECAAPVALVRGRRAPARPRPASPAATGTAPPAQSIVLREATHSVAARAPDASAPDPASETTTRSNSSRADIMRNGEPAPVASHAAPAAAPPVPHHDTGHAEATRHARLFYLAGRVLEIELAERLWAAGLPEGDVLAHVAAAIVGADDDPAWRWFGGVFDRQPAVPSVEEWALHEVLEQVQHALGRALVAHDVAASPAELEALLARHAAEVRVPSVASPRLATMVAHAVAALAVIVGARLKQAPSLAKLHALCAAPGQLVLADDTLHVLMAHDLVDIEHRRAGLDQNPGYVPWLARTLRIELTGGDTI